MSRLQLSIQTNEEFIYLVVLYTLYTYIKEISHLLCYCSPLRDLKGKYQGNPLEIRLKVRNYIFFYIFSFLEKEVLEKVK